MDSNAYVKSIALIGRELQIKTIRSGYACHSLAFSDGFDRLHPHHLKRVLIKRAAIG